MYSPSIRTWLSAYIILYQLYLSIWISIWLSISIIIYPSVLCNMFSHLGLLLCIFMGIFMYLYIIYNYIYLYINMDLAGSTSIVYVYAHTMFVHHSCAQVLCKGPRVKLCCLGSAAVGPSDFSTVVCCVIVSRCPIWPLLELSELETQKSFPRTTSRRPCAACVAARGPWLEADVAWTRRSWATQVYLI